MIRVNSHNGEGFRVMEESGEWKIGLLRYSERFSRFNELERHLLTDEVFVLICGSAVLYTDTESENMVRGKVYTVPAGVWHHVVVSTDAEILVVENRNTSMENSERKYFDGRETPYAHRG